MTFDGESRKVKKKYDGALYLALTALFAASVFNAAFPLRGGEILTVEAIRDGEVIPLGSLGEIGGSAVSFGEPGNFNEIAIGEGIRMVSADCPGGDCLRAGEIKKNGELIVCVPNRLVIRLVSSQRPEVDAVSR